MKDRLALPAFTGLALQALGRAQVSARAESDLGKHLISLFSHFALNSANSCGFFSWRR